MYGDSTIRGDAALNSTKAAQLQQAVNREPRLAELAQLSNKVERNNERLQSALDRFYGNDMCGDQACCEPRTGAAVEGLNRLHALLAHQQDLLSKLEEIL